MWRLTIVAAVFLLAPRMAAAVTGDIDCSTSKGTEYPILKVHTEVKAGLPSFAAYYIGSANIILLSNLDKPDVQLIKKQLDDAFAQNKRLAYMHTTRPCRTGFWYNLDEVPSVPVSFIDIMTGDNIYFRFK